MSAAVLRVASTDVRVDTVSSAIIDFEEELSRHAELFGRKDVLEKLLGCLTGDEKRSSGWVLLIGGPGVGKSAIVRELLKNLSTQTQTPHHLIRRGVEGWDRAEVIVQNLCAQLEQLSPEKARAELPADERLGELLKRLSKLYLVPNGKRLILVIDGLDEAASDSDDKNPLPRFLPRRLPPNVTIFCSSRPMYPHLDWFNQFEKVRRVDLDDPDWAASNKNAVREFWAHHGPRFKPPLAPALCEELVKRAEGNLLHATRLLDWLEEQPPERRVAENIPQGLTSFIAQIWAGLDEYDKARRASLMKVLGLACAAREALPPYLFEELLGGLTTSEELLRMLRPFLLEEQAQWHNGKRAYRPFHSYFRESIAEKLGDRKIRDEHRRIAKTLATWPPKAGDPARRLYALRHAVAHWIEAGAILRAQRLCANVNYLEAKCSELGVPAIVPDLEAVIRALDNHASLDLAAVRAALVAEAPRLQDHPRALPALLYNRLCCTGWSQRRITKVLHFTKGLPRLRLLHAVRIGPTLLHTFAGHEKPIAACIPTPDGSHVLSASADHTLRLWVLASGECVAVLRGHKDELTACAIMPDGKTAVSTSIDATVKIWDLTLGACVATLDNDGRWATTCAITPDGRRLVVGSDNGIITVWDLASRQRIRTLIGHSDYVTACLVTPRGQLVSASRDRSVRVWELDAGTCVHRLVPPDVPSSTSAQEREAHERGWITTLALLGEGEHLFATSEDGLICRWDLASGRCIQSFGAGQGRVDACAVLHEGRHLLCGMADGTLVSWDLAKAERVPRLPAHEGSVSAIVATRDGRRIFSASSDRTIKLWEVGGPESMIAQEGHAGPITACALTLDGSTAVSASEDKTLKVWDVATGACRATLRGHTDLVTACAISADGRRVISGARDGSVRVWLLKVDGMEFVKEHRTLVSGCAILPDGQMVTAAQDGALWLRNPGAFDQPTELGQHGGSVIGMAITPDGKLGLSIARDGTATLWDLASGRSIRTIRSVGVPVLAGALTPDGKRAVLARKDGKLEVHDLHGRQSVRVIEAHTRQIFGCAVTSDNARVITASEDGTLGVFSLETGEPLGTLRGTSFFRCVAANHGRICAGDQEGNLWLIIDDCAEPTARRGRLSPAQVRRLREAMARLYDTLAKALIIAKDAGIDEHQVNQGGSPSEFWDAILDEATKRQRLDALVLRALNEYSDDDDLRATAVQLGLEER